MNAFSFPIAQRHFEILALFNAKCNDEGAVGIDWLLDSDRLLVRYSLLDSFRFPLFVFVFVLFPLFVFYEVSESYEFFIQTSQF